ncbi:Uncharacterised protein [Fusobacterium necrogenes]|uniref:Uncharacterized protein n=1 Tax=Fusobacterium necrogenes TaxID=858 RepID=A0A377GXL3_9FUSO|nr:hypothetical protein [Fusobacterium necrogenes]STO31737.1 Uncharacterised protein [Fusobacterium necrogenes]
MNIKVRILSDKLDSSSLLIETKNLQLGTKVYTSQFPFTKDVGVLTIISDLDEKNNNFQLVVKDSQGNLLGKGNKFRAKIKSKESKDGILIYNINNAYFENDHSSYLIEVWNEDKLIDNFTLGASISIYNIYDNLDDRGVIILD